MMKQKTDFKQRKILINIQHGLQSESLRGEQHKFVAGVQGGDCQEFFDKLGARIVLLRKRKKMSQNDLALECGWDKPNLRRLEKEKLIHRSRHYSSFVKGWVRPFTSLLTYDSILLTLLFRRLTQVPCHVGYKYGHRLRNNESANSEH